ncbi:disulfide bond formation protein DsbA [Umezawaea sp.]|uniref:mycothiol-dependent nitroreductase Rv2466c family protein n=1 Tax=Umezawaea sp. TaxID=1955258 RepID=UPI002ED4CDE7
MTRKTPAGTWIAEIWFDPSCPYTWITSRWLVEVTGVRPVEIRWHVMSLSVLNEHRDDDPEGDPDGYLWVPVRVCAAVERHHGHEALGRFYTALWTHVRDGDDWTGDLETALAEAGLPRELAAAGTSREYDDAVRASHHEGFGLVGGDTGTPVIAVTGPGADRTAVFGPVVSRVPRGEEAGRLWDGLLLTTSVPGFHSITGPPLGGPEF